MLTEDQTTGRRTSPPRPKKGEEPEVDWSMTARQLASTVRQGRKITFILLEEYFTGYLTGVDATNYFVLVPPPASPEDNSLAHSPDGFSKVLVPKAAIQFLQMHDERTFREEALYNQMEPVVKPFREKIRVTYFEES